MKESDLVKLILNYLHAKGIPAWRQNQGMLKTEYKSKKSFTRFAGAKGISDIIGLKRNDGMFFAIECKVGRNKPTKIQEVFMAMINEAGGIAFVARSLEDVEEYL